ncbi:MAG: hypothetical protein HDR88_07330 [Bacteroides sp.]|nr:hypothetical protein [Bacteroides sp.]
MRKKSFHAIPIILFVITLLHGCTKFTGSKVPLYTGDTISVSDNPKVLVAYFSYGGNTKKVADAIAGHTKADLFRIERAEPYSEEFRKCAEDAKHELDDSIIPSLRGKLTDLESYDVIFVGCPVWWHTVPMPVLSFLTDSSYTFEGKIIVPFCSYANMFPHETLLEIVNRTPRSVHPSGFISEEGDTTGIYRWLNTINLLKTDKNIE